MKNPDHHLWERDGVFYCRQRVGAEQWVVSLGTSNKVEARKLRTAVLTEWNRKKVLGEARVPAVVRRAVSKPAARAVSIEDLLEHYRVIADARCRVKGKPRPATVTGNVAAFRRVFGATGEVAVCVTPAALRRYAERQLDGVDDELEMVRARITAASNISQAVSVLAAWTDGEYRARGLVLPDMRPVREADTVTAPMPQYQLTEERQALRAATEAAAAGLAADRPALYAIYLLAYMGGLRAGEIVQARWAWLSRDPTSGACWLHVPRSEPGWQVKSKPGSIRLAPAVLDWLMGQRTDGREHILPGLVTAREELIDEFSKWMREVGWARERFPKCAHELRKLAGVRWYSEHGAETAAKWLRDNLMTVLRFYADLDPARHPDPATPAVAGV